MKRDNRLAQGSLLAGAPRTVRGQHIKNRTGDPGALGVAHHASCGSIGTQRAGRPT